MVKEHNGPKNLPLRRTMIKSTVGHVRRPAYELPDRKDSQHVYGYEVARDAEGAGEVIGKWVQAIPSPAAKCGRSFIETNRKALSNGCISSTETREFAHQHPEILIKPPQKRQVGFSPPKNVTYGIKSKASEDIGALIKAHYTSFSNDSLEYPDLSSMKVKGKLPLPRETKSSIGKDVRLHPKCEKDPSEQFKMTKFKNVPSVLSTQPHAHQQHNDEDEE